MTTSWVQGHLDTRNPKSFFTDFEFANNFYADWIADLTADRATCDDRYSWPTLHGIKLVSHIQKRICALVASGYIEKSEVGVKVSADNVATGNDDRDTSTVEELAQNTDHVLAVSDGVFRCIACLQSVGRRAKNVKDWLKTRCIPSYESDRYKPVPVPPWQAVRIGQTLVHSSHNLFSYRGVICCYDCGFYGSLKTSFLGSPCEGHCTTSSKRARDALLSMNLPPSMKAWPVLDVIDGAERNAQSFRDLVTGTVVSGNAPNEPCDTLDNIAYVQGWIENVAAADHSVPASVAVATGVSTNHFDDPDAHMDEMSDA